MSLAAKVVIYVCALLIGALAGVIAFGYFVDYRVEFVSPTQILEYSTIIIGGQRVLTIDGSWPGLVLIAASVAAHIGVAYLIVRRASP